MLFAITCTDKPASLDLRKATRPAHLAYLESKVTQIVHGGAMLDAQDNPCGSILIVEMADRAAAEAFAAADPYAVAGLFENTAVRGFRTVFKDGAAA